MKLTSSYKVKINKTGFDKKAIRDTSILYRNAVSFFISLIEKEWSYVCGSGLDIVKLVEKLSHKTKDNLSPYMKAKDSYKEKIHLWRKKGIANRLSHMAHLNGLRYSTVCAKNTSKLTFDGSGEVSRGKDAGFKNNKMCKFKNGKEYNCDLSASYNIAARYFIREKIKPFEEEETQRLGLKAKCPLAFNGTSNVYSTLINLNVVLEA